MYKYKIEVNWSEEDQVYIANVPELEGCMTHGETTEQAIEMANEAIEGYLETLLDIGKPIPEPLSVKNCSGKISLRIPSNLHRDLLNQASVAGKSLNEYLIKKLSSENRV